MPVRILTSADAVAFRELRLRALKEHPEAFTSSYEEDVRKPLSATEQRLAPESGSVFWGAFVDDAMRGMIGMTREPRAKNQHKGDIVAMYVAPELGRRGLARALLHAAVDYARSEGGLEQLVLTVTRTNQAAAKLYKSAGFVTFGLEPRAIKVAGEYFDKEHMILFL
jgi:ribosomal protein S18 acetylase RimI-like enzyme